MIKKNHEKPWKIMKNIWSKMKNKGKKWKNNKKAWKKMKTIIKNHGKSWKNHEKSWKIMKNHEKSWEIMKNDENQNYFDFFFFITIFFHFFQVPCLWYTRLLGESVGFAIKRLSYEYTYSESIFHTTNQILLDKRRWRGRPEAAS